MSPSKRNIIINATVELVSKKGFQGAPTAKIAERAGVAEVTIFRNFKSKEGLLNEAFDKLLAEVQEYIRQDHDVTNPVKERFFELFKKLCIYMKRNPNNVNFMEQYLHSQEGWARRPDMLYESNVDFEMYPLISLLDQGRKSNEIKDLPMPILVGLVIGTIFNFHRAVQMKKIVYSKAIQESVINAAWEGIAA